MTTLPSTQTNNEENNAQSTTQQTGSSPAKILKKQSRTTLRKLAHKCDIRSLSSSSYPVIYHIIDKLLDKIFETIEKLLITDKNIPKTTISSDQLYDIFEKINPNISHVNTKEIYDKKSVFIATVFKRQLNDYLDKTNQKMTSKNVQSTKLFVENTLEQILVSASNISKNAKRTRVMDKDIVLAWELFNGKINTQ